MEELQIQVLDTTSTTDYISLVTHSYKATELLGQHIGAVINVGDVILLSGEMGTGKTTLTRGIAQGLDCSLPVRSPTFVLVNEHNDGRIKLSHCDLYRIENPPEVSELALHEKLEQGAIVVEWPQRAIHYLPSDNCTITLNFHNQSQIDNKRVLTIQNNGKRSKELMLSILNRLRISKHKQNDSI